MKTRKNNKIEENEKVLQALKDNPCKTPSMREICEITGIKSKSQVHRAITRLIESKTILKTDDDVIKYLIVGDNSQKIKINYLKHAGVHHNLPYPKEVIMQEPPGMVLGGLEPKYMIIDDPLPIDRDNTFGRQIKRYRRQNGLTQQQLADTMGRNVSTTTISNLESDKNVAGPELICEVAKSIGADISVVREDYIHNMLEQHRTVLESRFDLAMRYTDLS